MPAIADERHSVYYALYGKIFENVIRGIWWRRNQYSGKFMYRDGTFIAKKKWALGSKNYVVHFILRTKGKFFKMAKFSASDTTAFLPQLVENSSIIPGDNRYIDIKNHIIDPTYDHENNNRSFEALYGTEDLNSNAETIITDEEMFQLSKEDSLDIVIENTKHYNDIVFEHTLADNVWNERIIFVQIQLRTRQVSMRLIKDTILDNKYVEVMIHNDAKVVLVDDGTDLTFSNGQLAFPDSKDNTLIMYMYNAKCADPDL